MGPEYESVEAFAEFLMSDERTVFTLADVVKLAVSTRTSDPKVIAELESYGFAKEKREPPKAVRGFTSNPHDRFYGPGSCKTHGGSGWEQITGLAGQEG
jgi:hypothetical protein